MTAIRILFGPWLVWLIWLGIILQTKMLQVRFLVRAHAWVVGSVPSRGVCRRPLIDVSLPFYLPSPLSGINKRKKIKKRILLGLGVMSPKSVKIATERRSVHNFKGFAKNEEVAKINSLCLSWQTTLTCMWMRMMVMSSKRRFLRK